MTLFVTILLLAVIYYSSLAIFFLIMAVRFSTLNPPSYKDSVASVALVVLLTGFMIWIDVQQLTEIWRP